MVSEGRDPTPPLLVVGHRRPAVLARVFERVRQARPHTLFVALDLPVEGADDPEHLEVRRIVSTIDWPCELRLDIAEHRLGCSARIETAIDSAFDVVDRLVVVEDDILVDPGFLPWAATMLERHASDPTIGHIGGRNELVYWPPTDDDHVVVRRGSMWGWATWRDRWRRHRSDPRPAAPTGTTLLDEHVRHFDDDAGSRLEWDIHWTRFLVATGLRSIVPSRNLVDNLGFGAGATHTVHERDLRAGFPTGEAVPRPDAPMATDLTPDRYDEWSLLIDLMTTYRRPDAAVGLARLDARGAASMLDDVTRHHLAPFRDPTSALRALAHLRAFGIEAERTAPLEQALRRAQPTGGTA